jgi:hypothetical protein
MNLRAVAAREPSLHLGAAGASAEQVCRLAVQSRDIAGVEGILQRFGCELLFTEDVHGGRKLRTADGVVPMTVAGRLLNARPASTRRRSMPSTVVWPWGV